MKIEKREKSQPQKKKNQTNSIQFYVILLKMQKKNVKLTEEDEDDSISLNKL